MIDTGIDLYHPDLNVVAEADLVGDSTGQYANGRDPNGHGTLMSLVPLAPLLMEGVAGVAPGVALIVVLVSLTLEVEDISQTSLLVLNMF